MDFYCVDVRRAPQCDRVRLIVVWDGETRLLEVRDVTQHGYRLCEEGTTEMRVLESDERVRVQEYRVEEAFRGVAPPFSDTSALESFLVHHPTPGWLHVREWREDDEALSCLASALEESARSDGVSLRVLAYAERDAKHYYTASTWNSASREFARSSPQMCTSMRTVLYRERPHFLVCYDKEAEDRCTQSLSHAERSAFHYAHVYVRTVFERYASSEPWHALSLMWRGERADTRFLRVLERERVLSLTREHAALCGARWQDALDVRSLYTNEMYLLRACRALNFLPPPRRNHERERYEGARVLECALGRHEGWVACIDVTSLYPSVAIEHSICWSRDGSFLPRLWSHLLAERAEETREARRHALKLVANSLYGCLAAPAFRFYSLTLAARITEVGRAVLDAFHEEMKKYEDVKVVAGDTDSLFVHCSSLERAEELVRDAQLYFSATYREIQCKEDAVYHPLVMCGRKRYIGYDVRRERVTDKSGLVQRGDSLFERGFVASLLETALLGSEEEVRTLLLSLDARLREAAAEDLVMSRRVHRELASYPEGSRAPPHVRLAREHGGKRGDHVRYVYTDDGIGVVGSPPSLERYREAILQRVSPVLSLCGVQMERGVKRRGGGGGASKRRRIEDVNPRTRRALGPYSVFDETPKCVVCREPYVIEEEGRCACGTFDGDVMVARLRDALARAHVSFERGDAACAQCGVFEERLENAVTRQCLCERMCILQDNSLTLLQEVARFDRASEGRHHDECARLAHSFASRHPLKLH